MPHMAPRFYPHGRRRLDFEGPAPYTGWVRSLLVLSLFLLAAPDLRAAVEIRVSGEHVDIQATNAPLADILDGLSRQTPMKIVYEGPPPRQLLSVDLKGRTPAEAVLAILEGQGLSFTVALDPSGTKVQTLLMAGGNNAPSAAPPRSPLRPERPAREPMRESVVEEPVDDLGAEEGEESEVPPDTGRPTPPQARPSQPPAPPSQGVFLPVPGGAADYPTSVFAPRPPAPEEPKTPKGEATPPPFNP
jgi:hypothetical protein